MRNNLPANCKFRQVQDNHTLFNVLVLAAFECCFNQFNITPSHPISSHHIQIISHPTRFYPIPSHPNLFHPIPRIQYRPIPSFQISSDYIPSYPIPSHIKLSHLSPTHPIPPQSIPSPSPSHYISSHAISFRPIPFIPRHQILSHPISSHPIIDLKLAIWIFLLVLALPASVSYVGVCELYQGGVRCVGTPFGCGAFCQPPPPCPPPLICF